MDSLNTKNTQMTEEKSFSDLIKRDWFKWTTTVIRRLFIVTGY